MAINQLEHPKAGDLIAVMHTTMGDIKIRLFPDQVPKTVENFTTHAKNGYYNGVLFHRVISGFMIQGGDPQGTGMGGESIWGGPLADEFVGYLNNMRGALSMANAGHNTNGGHFFIVQAPEVHEGLLAQMEGLTDRGFPRQTIDNYKAVGGTPHLDFKHAVFGQVYEGMDVVDAIASVETGRADKPKEDVKITSIDIGNYAQ